MPDLTLDASLVAVAEALLIGRCGRIGSDAKALAMAVVGAKASGSLKA